ncbi:caspase family protein [Longimicrobium sp.]|uniref:caspase family protein n=1 Tax=Longimicrobium sp. TaxID=2029185 RepID=UPI003B3A1C3E
MPRALSIHIGVNEPQTRYPGQPLRHSEATAWRMADLASRAGYNSLRVLRGAEATRQAVDDALAGAAQTAAAGDIVFISFSGHGSRENDLDRDDRTGFDEAWCLYDDILLDDKLAGFWRLFASGVRILVVVESCFSGGTGRTGDLYTARPGCEPAPANGLAPAPPSVMRGARFPTRGRTRGPVRGEAQDGGWAESCIATPPHDADGIQASVLMLCASCKEQPAIDGLYSEQLLAVWKGGAFRDTFCDLHGEVHARVMCRARQTPQILMLGVPDPAFPLEPAFHLDRRQTRHFRGARTP